MAQRKSRKNEEQEKSEPIVEQPTAARYVLNAIYRTAAHLDLTWKELQAFANIVEALRSQPYAVSDNFSFRKRSIALDETGAGSPHGISSLMARSQAFHICDVPRPLVLAKEKYEATYNYERKELNRPISDACHVFWVEYPRWSTHAYTSPCSICGAQPHDMHSVLRVECSGSGFRLDVQKTIEILANEGVAGVPDLYEVYLPVCRTHSKNIATLARALSGRSLTPEMIRAAVRPDQRCTVCDWPIMPGIDTQRIKIVITDAHGEERVLISEDDPVCSSCLSDGLLGKLRSKQDNAELAIEDSATNLLGG